jgi:hypothetical protein
VRYQAALRPDMTSKIDSKVLSNFVSTPNYDFWPRPCQNRATIVLTARLQQAANALIRSRSYLGAQYRRLRTKLGAPKAITAMAHRLARLVYRMLKYGQRYVDKGTEYYEQRYRNQQTHLLKKNATKLGFQITEARA